MPNAWTRGQRGIAIGIVGALTVTTGIAFALNSPGYAQANVDLSTSTVWTTNNTDSLVGRVNMQIKQLNSSFKSNPNFDVLQGDGLVFAVDRTKNQIKTVDQSTVTTGAQIGLPANADVAYGAGILSIIDPSSGKWWAGSSDALSGLDPATAPPAMTTAPNAVAVVTQSGRAFAVAPGSNKIFTIAFNPDGTPIAPAKNATGTTDATGGPTLAAPLSASVPFKAGIAITAVGDTPVVLDRAAGQLYVSGHRVPVADAAAAVLQQSGPAADAVLVETRTQLLQYPLDGGAPTVVFGGGNGSAIAPVRLDGCAWAAWNGPTTLEALACDGGAAQSVTLPGTGKRDPVFRVNDGAIVLNDRTSGTIWAVAKTMTVTVIDNWEQVKPENQSDTTDNTDGSKTQSEEIAAARADCSKQGPAKSTAKDAKYQVRAGRATVLPVLDFVNAGDCAAVVVGTVSKLPTTDGTIDIVNAGQALQVTVPSGVSGRLPSLTYSISDGVNPPVSASLVITVVPAGQPGDIKKQRDSSTEVEINGSVTYNVLPDYYSTTGDDLYLTGASATSAGDTVDFTPAGQLTFHDKGSSGTGNHEVLFTITDGDVVKSGKLTVNVQAEGTGKPIASAVVAASLVNVPTTVNPLNSVLSPSLDPLRLTNVSSKSGGAKATATVNSDDNTVTLSASAAGTYYFAYAVAAGSGKSTGVLRFDVTDRPVKPAPPVATADIVYLPAGDSVRVDPTANDLDPNGSGLAVQQVGTDPSGNLTVTDTDMRTLQIAARGALSKATSLTYSVSNGVATAAGQIRVIPVAPLTDPPAPTANPISLTVRAGDAITLPVDRFASDPRGQALTPTIVPGASGTTPGVLFADSTGVRYLAPTTAPAAPVKFSYSVTNTSGQTSSAAAVTLTVTDRNPAVDSAPNAPATVVSRVFTGETTTVALPLDGIDPDGDWVTVASVDGTTGNLGTATVDGLDAISYTALAKPGIDTINYTVTDPYGKKTPGTVTMIVVGTPDVVSPPVAPNLVASMRPGKAVSIRPLDSGVSGENVKLATPAIDPVDGWQAVGDGDALVISAPGKTSGIAPFTYHVVDDRGLTASGVITVTISATAPLVPPKAQDVIVTPAMATDKVNAVVNVAGSIQNNTGKHSELSVGLTAGEPATVISATVIRIPLTANRQVLAYTVTDGDGQVAKAFIVVPPKTDLVAVPQQQQDQPLDQPPTPKAHMPTLTVDAGATVTGKIADYVDVPAGKTAQIPARSPMSATQGVGHLLDAGTFSYTAAKTGAGRDALSLTASVGGSPSIRIGVPIIIIPATPVLNNTNLDVEVGQSGTVNLASLVSPTNYPGVAGLRYTAGSPGNGFTATRNGTTVTVAVAGSVPKGATARVPISVTDVKGATVAAGINVTATGTTKPLPTVSDASQIGKPGVTSTFDVLAGSTDPFGAGLTVQPDPTVLQGKGTVSVSGSSVRVTPAAGQIGDMVVQFTVADGTKDQARYASGKLTLTVKDKPHAPGQPVPVPNSATASSVTLTWQWQQNWANGGTVRPFVVSAPGLDSTTCPTNSCQISRLTPGRQYVFTVTATNEDGSAQSPRSAPITPDAAPPAPSAPVVTLSADRQLTVTWNIGKDDKSYSPVTSAVLTEVVNGTDGKTTAVPSSGRGSQDFSGLDIGNAYSFYLTVTNKKGSAQSAPSAPQHPNTTPGPATAVSIAFDPGSHAATVSWSPPAANSLRPTVQSYVITYTDNGSSRTLPVSSGSATSAELPSPVDGHRYAVSNIVAHNKFGDGDPSSGSSGSVTAFTTPTPVTSLTATATGADHSVQLSNVQGGASSGRTGSDFYSTDNGGSWKQFSPGDTVTTDSGGGTLANGQQYTFTARVCYPDESPYTTAQLCGKSASATATPYGPVGAPVNVRQTDNSLTQIRFNWSAPADNGRSPMTTKYSVDGGAFVNFGAGDASVVVGNWGCGTQHTINVQGFDSEGHAGPQSGAVAGSTSACPAPAAPTGLTKTSSGQNSIRFSWNAPPSNGKGPLTNQYRVNSGGFVDAGTGANPSATAGGLNCGTSYNIDVRAVDTTGLAGPVTSKNMSTDACPASPVVDFTKATHYNTSTCWDPSCYSVRITVANFTGVSSVACTNNQVDRTTTINLTGGAGSAESTWYFGYPSKTMTITCSGGGKTASVSKVWNSGSTPPS
ncbi:fibronectin type III domain-containing protein [Nakamurella panacisegetis]|nr:fibronectin type III domain-containing protein [Nakamurella panacisegetis]